jgi:hypothetical protein
MQTELERIADRAKAAREAHPGYAEASRKRAKAATETATVAETATEQPQASQMPAKTFKAPPPPNTPRKREMVSESTTTPSRGTRAARKPRSAREIPAVAPPPPPPCKGTLPASKPQLSVSLSGDPAKVAEAWERLLAMMPASVVVSRGTPGPEADRREPGKMTVRYNVFQWDE